ncbi:MAG: septum formation protein Maf [Anaerolineales bacterium]|nr:septum formation protein Maf [Anaerolineales bacterium]
MRPVILASASPRRHELLALGGIDFRVSPVSVPEIAQPGEAPAEFARRLSQVKARAAPAAPGAVVIGADTIVVLAGEIIGKPAGPDHAALLLRQLRGRPHLVFTAITVLDTASGAELSDLVEARVPMRAYSDAEIAAYVATGDPLDKAGAYAIQYPGFQPVDLARFEDCFANVMGLPVCRVLRLLAQVGVTPRPGANGSRPPAGCAAFDAAACPIVAQLTQQAG